MIVTSKPPSAPAAYLDPHTYTSGRWLRHDKLQIDSRYIEFDFDALCRRVIELSPGATSIATNDKKEGGFNRVFIFTTDNAETLVARLPFAFAGPPSLATNSEVATIRYLQTNTSVPIPKILDWNDDPSNAIGSEYIIMEHAAGTQLHQKWPTMAIVDIKFPAYGSVYFADSSLDSTCTRPLNQNFSVGPHCSARYWDCNVGEFRYYHSTKPNQGPWDDLSTYCDGLVDIGISRIPPVNPVPDNLRRYHGSVSTHLRLLEFGRAVINNMCKDHRIRDAAAPTLFHPDLHKRNIFVSDDDPTVITSIIDLAQELGLVGSCPYPVPTAEELAVHQKEYKYFEAAHDLRNHLTGLLNTASDGWVPAEEWETAKLANKELFGLMLETVLSIENPDDDEPVKDEGDVREIWPFEF
ncbi:hypothetical protein V501_01662 [Pseudogymnoascus sp. VKM F-4519 (FW-2642)]|nr:hypothetical protein V501_01662 [Pseudogymnoascus sp. VKM F-4519 (FW-2642)]